MSHANVLKNMYLEDLDMISWMFDCIMSSMVLSLEYLSPFLYVEKTNIALNFDHCQDSKIEDDFLFKPYYLIAA